MSVIQHHRDGGEDPVGLPGAGLPAAHAAVARDADATAVGAESYPEAARLLGAAGAVRERTGEVRYQIYQADYEASVAVLRDAMGQNDFDVAWAGGAALSIEEAVAYAQRGPRRTQAPVHWLGLADARRTRRRQAGQ